MLLSPHVNADIWKMTPTPVGFRNSFYRSLMWFWFSPEALATFQLECLSLPQHHPKAFCSWKWVWTQEKMLLAHILCTCAKMHSTEAKAMWVRLFPSTRLRLAEGLSLHKYTAEMFSSPSSTQGVCAAFREAIASAALCCLQQEPSSAMPTSSTYTPSVKSSECSWTAKVPPVKFSTALEPRFIRPVTQNHCYRFSMRVHWGVEMTVLPLISKGMERWQGHRRSIKVFETALKLLCTDAEPWSHVQWLGSIAVIHFPISSSRTPDSSKVLCLQLQPGICQSRIWSQLVSLDLSPGENRTIGSQEGLVWKGAWKVI